MELKDLNTREAHEEGIEVNIKHPATGEPTDVFLTIVGPDSRDWRRIAKASLRAAVARKAGEELTEDEQLEKDVDQIAGITKGWRGITEGGEELDFSKDACKELYLNAPYILDQVDLAAGVYRDFTQG